MSDPQLPPMGWYPDPADAQQERYWDGATWTRNTRVPPPVAPSEPAGRWTPAEYDSHQRAANPDQAGFGNQAPGPINDAGFTAGRLGDPTGGPASGWQQQPALAPNYGAPAYPFGPITADGVPLASFGARLGAYIVDVLILLCVQMTLLVPFWSRLYPGMMDWFSDVLNGGSGIQTSPFDAKYGIASVLNSYQICILLAGMSYTVLMMRFKSATLGMLAVGLRVVPLNQGRQVSGLSWFVAIIRNLVWYGISLLPGIGVVLVIANGLWPLVNPRRQAWHDMVAHTQVINLRWARNYPML